MPTIKRRVFLVEDNSVIREALTAAMEETGDVEIVGSATEEKQALAWFGSRTNGCDVAVIDVFLNAGSGLGVLEGMKHYQHPPQRVVLTNYATSEMRCRCLALGADVVFDKSTEVENLLAWFACH